MLPVLLTCSKTSAAEVTKLFGDVNISQTISQAIKTPKTFSMPSKPPNHLPCHKNPPNHFPNHIPCHKIPQTISQTISQASLVKKGGSLWFEDQVRAVGSSRRWEVLGQGWGCPQSGSGLSCATLIRMRTPRAVSSPITVQESRTTLKEQGKLLPLQNPAWN